MDIKNAIIQPKINFNFKNDKLSGLKLWVKY